jgi:hypothetical protein
MLAAIFGLNGRVIECWLDCLQVPYAVSPMIDLCIMAQTGRCTGEFVFDFEDRA